MADICFTLSVGALRSIRAAYKGGGVLPALHAALCTQYLQRLKLKTFCHILNPSKGLCMPEGKNCLHTGEQGRAMYHELA